MNFKITVTGHKELTEEQSIKIENAIAEETRRFVRQVRNLSGDELEGFEARGSFGHIAPTDMSKTEAEERAEVTEKTRKEKN